jgi:hypothetical protein
MVKATFCILLSLLLGIVPQTPQAPQTPLSLEQALPHAYWNTEEQGALLAVAPERTLLRTVKKQPPLRIPPIPPRGYNLTNLLSLFDYAPIRTRSVTAIAPTTMRVFTRPTISPEEGSYEGKGEAASALFETFTAAQWKLLGDNNGIGMADLTDKQQKLYAKLLPRIALLDPIETSEETKTGTHRPKITLTPMQIKQMRLRIAKHIDIEFLFNGGESSTYEEHDDETNTHDFSDETDDETMDDALQKEKLPWRIFPKVANRTKPSDLDYKSPRLNPEISLKGINTVGDLVARIGQTTRLNLSADARVQPLHLYLRGESARAGDLLEALCVSLMATFRKMPDGNGYLLTEDRDGLGARVAAWEEWDQIRYKFRRAREEKRAEIMRRNGFTMTTDDPYNLSPDVQKKMHLEEREDLPKEKRGIDMHLLSSDLQKTLRQDMQRFIQHAKKDLREDGSEVYQDIVTDRVEMNYSTRAYFIVPSIGQVRADIDYAEDILPDTSEKQKETPLPAVLPLPASWKNRRLYVSVDTPEETKQVIDLAQQYGFSGVYFEMQPTASQAIPFFKVAIAEGKAKKIAVGAFCDIFPAGEETENRYAIDKNILGETGYEFYQRMQKFPSGFGFDGQSAYEKNTIALSKTNLQKLQKELATIVQSKELTGLSCLVIRADLPSYSLESYSREGKPLYGYTLQNRLDFFKTNRVDPIDIVTEDDEYYNLYSPYFNDAIEINTINPNIKEGVEETTVTIQNPNFINVNNKWGDFLEAQRKKVEPDLFQTLKIAAPSLPLYYDKIKQSFWMRWQTPTFKDINIEYKSGQNYALAVAKAVQRVSPEMWRTVLISDDTPAWIDSLKYQMNEDKDIPFLQGVVLDCSYATLTDTKKVLEAFRTLEKNAKSPNSPR